MLGFWLGDRGKKVDRLNFHGDIIYWNPRKAMDGPKKAERRKAA